MDNFFGKKPFVGALFVFILSCLIGLTVFQKELNTNGDNGAYICYAISLAHGDGFRLPNYPDHPKSNQYPILFPLFLAAFIKLFGYNLLILKCVMLAVFGLAMSLLFLIAGKTLKGKLLFGFMLLVVMNYWLLDNSSINMSELTFTLVIVAGIIYLIKFEEGNRTANLIVAGCFFISAVFVRTVGIAAVLAYLLYLLYTKKSGFALIMFGLFIMAYFLQKIFMGPGNNYLHILFMKDPYRPDLGTIAFMDFLKQIVDNAVFYTTTTVEMTLLAFMNEGSFQENSGRFIFTGFFVILLFIYPIKSLKVEKVSLFIRVFVLLYIGVLLPYPKVWSGSRYIVPIIPFLFLIAFQNSGYFISRFLHTSYLNKALNLMVAVSVIWAILNYGAIYKKTHEPLSSDWQDYFSLAEWTKENIPDTSIVCSRSAFLFYLKSWKMSIPIPYIADRAKALQYLIDNKVGYLLIDKFKWTGTTHEYAAPLLQLYPDKFHLVYEKPEASLYRFTP